MGFLGLIIVGIVTVAFALTCATGAARRVIRWGLAMAIGFPLALAAWDPGYAWFDSSRGTWFFVGLVVAVPAFLCWLVGVGLASVARRAVPAR